jgi:hypothetical protein
MGKSDNNNIRVAQATTLTGLCCAGPSDFSSSYHRGFADAKGRPAGMLLLRFPDPGPDPGSHSSTATGSLVRGSRDTGEQNRYIVHISGRDVRNHRYGASSTSPDATGLSPYKSVHSPDRAWAPIGLIWRCRAWRETPGRKGSPCG